MRDFYVRKGCAKHPNKILISANTVAVFFLFFLLQNRYIILSNMRYPPRRGRRSKHLFVSGGRGRHGKHSSLILAHCVKHAHVSGGTQKNRL